MWAFYLAASEIGDGGHIVFQLQLAKRIDAAPITRVYIEPTERLLAEKGRSAT
jgi:cyclopropane-fatty-acyl-phospholipid synthase